MQEIDFARAKVPELHEILAGLRDQGPIVQVVYHGEPAWLTTTHEVTRAALKDEAKFPSASIQEPLVGKTMQSMVGDQHRKNRSLISSAFIPRSVEAQRKELLEPLAIELVEELANRSAFDLVSQFAQRYPALVITRLLGIPVHDEIQFLDWGLLLLQFPWDPDGARAAWRDFRAYLAPVLRERREDPREDLLSALLQVELDGQKLSDDEIFSFLGILYPAGADTAYKAISSMMAAVLSERKLFERARDEASSRDLIADETLRWEAPVALLPRTVACESEIAGTRIKPGDRILLGIAAANRDPDIFVDPHRFDPDRERLNDSLVFGHGPHVCLGANLARTELSVALGALAERFPNMSLEPSAKIEMLGAILRGPRSVPVLV